MTFPPPNIASTTGGSLGDLVLDVYDYVRNGHYNTSAISGNQSLLNQLAQLSVLANGWNTGAPPQSQDQADLWNAMSVAATPPGSAVPQLTVTVPIPQIRIEQPVTRNGQIQNPASVVPDFPAPSDIAMDAANPVFTPPPFQGLPTKYLLAGAAALYLLVS